MKSFFSTSFARAAGDSAEEALCGAGLRVEVPEWNTEQPATSSSRMVAAP
jgi:hypothetical protein